MVNLYMIDTNSMGIPMIYQIQREKCFPLPTYDLETINRVSVTVFGKILDKNYTQLLHANGNLDLQTVYLLDRIQKREPISHENYVTLRKNGLVEGRYPNIFVSFKVATAVGHKTAYIRNRGLDESVCRHLIMQAHSGSPCRLPCAALCRHLIFSPLQCRNSWRFWTAVHYLQSYHRTRKPEKCQIFCKKWKMKELSIPLGPEIRPNGMPPSQKLNNML